MISIKDFEHFRQETINESIEERNNFYNFRLCHNKWLIFDEK